MAVFQKRSGISVPSEYEIPEYAEWLPCVGLRFSLKKRGMEIEYPGYGEAESYCDRMGGTAKDVYSGKAEELKEAKHDFELKKSKWTEVFVGVQAGIGSNSCGPVLAEEFRIPRKKSFTFYFAIK